MRHDVPHAQGQHAGTDRRTVDTSASERLLHRALYVLKVLRAMVLHVLLGLAAAALFALTGIDGLYPLVDSVIHAMRAAAIRQRLDGGPLAGTAYWIGVGVMLPVLLAWLVWMYRSIIAARRFALRVQAVLLLALNLNITVQAWPSLQFAFGHLDPTFAALAAVAVVVQFVFPGSVAVSMWQVSGATERHSLLATLDPRLAPSRWVFLNKMLELPRTPLQSASTAAAYALALGGALLSIASIMHLLTLGGTRDRMALLAIACAGDVSPTCRGLSLEWAWDVPLTLLLAAIGIKVAAGLQSASRRLGGLGVSDVLRRPDDPFLLYLRPFDTDDVILPTPRLPLLSRLFSFRPFPVRIEEELFDVADGHRPLIAVGKPGGRQATPGGMAYRTYLDDSAWQDYVADKIRRAERIVLLMKDGAGVRWEIERVVAEGAADKTLFLVDPAVSSAADWQTLKRMVVPLLQGAGVVPQNFDFTSRPIGFYVHRGTVVEIVNSHRTATSYRTAFSHFLAESLQ